LILYGNKFHLTLILIQTFRVTALPIINKHWSEIIETYERVIKIIQEENKNLVDNIKSMYNSKDEMKKDLKKMSLKEFDVSKLSKEEVDEYQNKLEK